MGFFNEKGKRVVVGKDAAYLTDKFCFKCKKKIQIYASKKVCPECGTQSLQRLY